MRSTLTIAALDGLNVNTDDIMNEYLTTPVNGNIWAVLGPEFGSDCSRIALVVRAFYGFKSAGAAFMNHLVDCMSRLKYEPCKVDGDVWLKPDVRPSDGHKYYSYIIIYGDDVLCIHNDGVNTVNILTSIFK